MTESISAILYALLGQAIGYVLISKLLPFHMVLRTAVVWSGSVIALMLLIEPSLVLIVSTLLLILVAPKVGIDRAAFFLLAAPALPIYLGTSIDLPGLGHIVELDHYKISVLVCIAPLAIFGSSRRSDMQFAVSAFPLMYTVYAALIACLYFGIASGVRTWVTLMLTFFLPFFVIARSMLSSRDIDTLIRAFVSAALMLSSVALIVAFKQWDFYKIHADAVVAFADFRSGFLRVEATANTHSLGMHVGLGFIFLEHIKTRLVRSTLFIFACRIILFGILLATDSRGALIGTMIGYAVYLIAINRNAMLRRFLTLSCFVGAIAVGLWFVSGDFTNLGVRDSFTYRQRLIETSIEFVRENLLFGNVNFIATGYFNHLIQGQGIIDITNQYLLISVQYGLIGSLFYWGAFVTSGGLLLYSRPAGNKFSSPETRARTAQLLQWRALVLGSMIGWLFLLATTSDVALTMHVGLVLAALALGVAVEARRIGAELRFERIQGKRASLMLNAV